MKRSHLLVCSFCIGLLFYGCIEEIKIDELVGPTSGRLVVEGLITDQFMAHQVRLTRVNNALPVNPALTVPGAKVTIADGDNTWILSEQTEGSGIYVTDAQVRGEAGKTYTLTVAIGAETYYASDTMEPADEFDEHDTYLRDYMGKGSNGYYLGGPLVLYGDDLPGRITYEVKDMPVDSILTYYSFPGVDPDNVFPTFTEQIFFKPGSELKQTKYSLSRKHYLFIRAMLLEVKYYGGFVGSVRANVPTNLSEGALGFFGASATRSRSIKVN
jgi:hypothetical protein